MSNALAVKDELLSFNLQSLLDPEWRYSRALKLRTNGVKFYSSDEDKYVVRLANFLDEWHSADASSLDEIRKAYPDIYWAYTIYDQKYRGPRFHLEALVVAGLSTNEISAYLAIPEEIIISYEKCFFDIREHLSRENAVRTTIKSRIAGRRGDLDPDPFWKLVALSCGPTALMALWSDGTLEPKEVSQLDEIIAAQIRRNAIKAVTTRNITHENANEVINEYLMLRHEEANLKKIEADVGQSEVTNTSDFVAALLSAVQFSVASVSDRTDTAFLEVSNVAEQAKHLLTRMQSASGVKNVPSEDVG